MHAITLSYTLSYEAAVRLGVPRAGSAQIEAGPVLALLDPPTRAWLALHPQASFRLDDVVESPSDLEGARLAQCLAREIRSAAKADDPQRLADAVAGKFIRGLDDAKAGEYVSAYESVRRRVSDGSNVLSGGLDKLRDRDVSPIMVRSLERYLERCLAALEVPHVQKIEDAPDILREVYVEGERRVKDRAIKSAIEAAKAGPLPCTAHVSSAREYMREGKLGVSCKGAGKDRTWVVCFGPKFNDPRLAGVIEDAVATLEHEHERKQADEKAKAQARENAILAVLTDDQRSRRALGGLPKHELVQTLHEELIARMECLLGVAVETASEEDEERIVWGELPRGGSDLAAELKELDYVERWGRMDECVAVEATDLSGSSWPFIIQLDRE